MTDGLLSRRRGDGRRGDAGATAPEYALIIAGIAVVIVVAVALIGTALTGGFDDAGATLEAGTGVVDAEVDGCPDVPGLQDVGADCNANPVTTDVCPYDQGVQTDVSQCTIVDLCPNDPGLQTKAPCPADAPPPPPPVVYASWTQIGSSRNYRWLCPNGFNLGTLGKPRRSATAPIGQEPPPCQ